MLTVLVVLMIRLVRNFIVLYNTEKMLKREREALEALDKDVKVLEMKLADPNDPTNENDFEFIGQHLHMLVNNLVWIVSRWQLKFWQKLAFSIVVHVLKKLAEADKLRRG